MENIYSTKKFQELNESDDLIPINFVFKDKENHSEFEIHGLSKEKKAAYGIYAPFWLPKIVLEHSDLILFDIFVSNLISAHKKKKYESIEIRLPPSFYLSSLNIFKFILIKNSFKISNIALWQTINIKDFNNQSTYRDSLKYSSRKEIKKFVIQYQFSLREIDLNNYSAVRNSYNIINLNRKKIGTSLKYSINYLLNLINLEPEKIKIFDLLVEQEIVASAICHMSGKKVLYIAAWGDVEHNLTKSPMYIFASELVEYCITNNYAYLDFGTSSDLNLFTPNLFKFKENIGCFNSLQETFSLGLG